MRQLTIILTILFWESMTNYGFFDKMIGARTTCHLEALHYDRNSGRSKKLKTVYLDSKEEST
ncbi:TPA: hypothetical protein ACF1JQ_001505 [Streptococcus pyogenes]|uniref:hypothetical protein n=1 Tax=Streptococcus pyogenes TaxID=1314 RepID=UPI000DBE1591